MTTYLGTEQEARLAPVMADYLRRYPYFPITLYQAALFEIHQDRAQKAQELMERALLVAPNDPDILHMLAVIKRRASTEEAPLP